MEFALVVRPCRAHGSLGPGSHSDQHGTRVSQAAQHSDW